MHQPRLTAMLVFVSLVLFFFLAVRHAPALAGDAPVAQELAVRDLAKDLAKSVIELPAKHVLLPSNDGMAGLVAAPLARAVAAEGSGEKPFNPRVAPGLVKWHPDLDTAKRAAGVSRKPVLLVQVLGDLDHEFC